MEEAKYKKPLTEVVRPEITRLPAMTASRRFFRRLVNGVFRLLVALFTRTEVRGLENFPRQGAALLVMNHLGDADGVVSAAFFPRFVDALSKADLYDFPVLGWVMETYGVIWIHRGQPDRRALRVAFQGLEEGRVVAIAPEGRESLTGSLEEGTGGAAFLALRANVPLLPVTVTGTENRRIFGNMKRLLRTPVTLTFGPLFRLEGGAARKQAIAEGTETIMRKLAEQLPPEYRGVYRRDEIPG